MSASSPISLLWAGLPHMSISASIAQQKSNDLYIITTTSEVVVSRRSQPDVSFSRIVQHFHGVHVAFQGVLDSRAVVEIWLFLFFLHTSS